MKEIPLSKLKSNCSAVMEGVRKTRKPVRVTRRGLPIAEITGDIVGPIGALDNWDYLTR